LQLHPLHNCRKQAAARARLQQQPANKTLRSWNPFSLVSPPATTCRSSTRAINMVLSAGILVASICNSSSSVYSYPTVCVCVMERQAARSRPTAGEPKRRVKGRGEAGGVVSCRMCGGTYVLYVRMGWEEGIWILEGEPAGDGEGVRRSVGRRELLLVTWRRRGPEDCRFVGTESSAGGAAPPPRLPLRPLARSSQLPFSASASRAWLLQAGAGANLVISSSATVLCPAGQGLPHTDTATPHHQKACI
jgi:hypothetical protein